MSRRRDEIFVSEENRRYLIANVQEIELRMAEKDMLTRRVRDLEAHLRLSHDSLKDLRQLLDSARREKLEQEQVIVQLQSKYKEVEVQLRVVAEASEKRVQEMVHLKQELSSARQAESTAKEQLLSLMVNSSNPTMTLNECGTLTLTHSANSGAVAAPDDRKQLHGKQKSQKVASERSA